MQVVRALRSRPLPPHAPCRLQLRKYGRSIYHGSFASTRSVQIATQRDGDGSDLMEVALPPHAPCRLQLQPSMLNASLTCFASTRSVQIATWRMRLACRSRHLCLHTLRADCNGLLEVLGIQPELCLHTLRADCNTKPWLKGMFAIPFASTRSVQIATAEMHRMQYALFRTCVESVDSFSVLNKSMLR